MARGSVFRMDIKMGQKGVCPPMGQTPEWPPSAWPNGTFSMSPAGGLGRCLGSDGPGRSCVGPHGSARAVWGQGWVGKVREDG